MPDEFARYSCQLALPDFNEATQQKLQSAKVLIAGVGGLGCPCGLYLAASGIGTIGIADYDTISITNLHRQVLYTEEELGLKKSVIACAKLQNQNPGISVISHDVKITSQNVMELINRYDIIVDCTDNFDTRYLLNDACVLQHKPLVYGAIYQYEGQVSVWNVSNNDGTRSPNYRDVFPAVNAAQIPNCADGGVMPSLTGIIGCMQANEVIKYLRNDSEILSGKLLMFNVRTMQSTVIKTGNITKTKITSLADIAKEPLISVMEVKEEITNNTYQLIDVRTPDEHASFNIGGENFHLNELEKNIRELKDTKPIILYCSTGKRSGEAVRYLKQQFPGINIFSLEGGLEKWKQLAIDQ